MAKNPLLTAHHLTAPYFGIEGLPEHVTRLEILACATDAVLIRCDFYAAEEDGKKIKASFEKLQQEYVMVRRDALPLLGLEKLLNGTGAVAAGTQSAAAQGD